MPTSSVNKEQSPGCELVSIKLPALHSFFSPIDDFTLQIAHRIEAHIVNNSELHLLFGVNVFTKETTEVNQKEVAAISTLAEVAGKFKFKNKIPKADKLTDIPLIANLLAMMYPFIREKITYCFHANQVNYFLGPINIHTLIRELSNESNTSVIDERCPTSAR